MVTVAAPAHDLQVTQEPVSGLRTYHRNPRQGNTSVIAQSLVVNGQYRPLVVNAGTFTDRPREVLAGNHTLMAARDLGWESVSAVTVDVDDDQCARICAADNRSADLGEYDERLLLELLNDLPDLDGTGYEPGDLAELEKALRDGGGTGGAGSEHDDDPVEAPEDPITRLGDVWQLGEHRLICGSSFDRAVLDELLQSEQPALILTDPPYGMNLNTDYSNIKGSQNATMRTGGKRHRPVEGDDEPFDSSPLRAYFSQVPEQFWFGADYYRRTLTDDDLDGSWLVWDKRSEETEEVIGSSFELIWSAVKHKRHVLRHYWCGAFGNPEARNRIHPTQKPTALLGEILGRWSKTGALVVDLFGGSGSTLIAAERTGRAARLVELDEAYCDAICRRFQQITGIKPTRDGQPHDFTEEAA